MLSTDAAALMAPSANPAIGNTPIQADGRASRKRARVEKALLISSPGIASQVLGLLAEEEHPCPNAVGQVALLGAPAWANALLGALTNQLNGMQAQLSGMQAQLSGMQAEQANLNARVTNGLLNLQDPLMPLMTATGVVPPNFPALRADVANLSNAELQGLLIAYGQAVPRTLRDRRQVFATFVGVRLV